MSSVEGLPMIAWLRQAPLSGDWTAVRLPGEVLVEIGLQIKQ